MLKIKSLQKKIEDAVTANLQPALEAGFLTTFPQKSDAGDKLAKQFAETVTDVFAKSFSSALAGAIDYYVHSISVQGTIITTGSPATQTAIISSSSAVTNGVVPNSLGIF